MTTLPNASPPHRSAKACRVNPFLDADSHLSLGDVARRENLARYREKCAMCGIELPPADAARWAALNRVPRRPPIYPTVEKVPA